MSQRFNFLLQVMLVALLFSVVSVPGYGQFVVSKKNTSNADGEGGNGNLFVPCTEPNEIQAKLLFNFDSINNALAEISNFGCDLFVGLRSNDSGNTSFVSLDSIDPNGISEVYVDLGNDIVNQTFGDFELVDSSLNVYDAVQFIVSVPIPPVGPALCNHLNASGVYADYEYYSFMLQLYCKVGENYEEVNVCEVEEYFFSSLLEEECSLGTNIIIKRCCEVEIVLEDDIDPCGKIGKTRGTNRNEVAKRIQNYIDVDNEIESKGASYREKAFLPTLKFANHELSISSNRNTTYEVTCHIINLNGQVLLSDLIELRFNDTTKISLQDFKEGIYIAAVSDSYGNVVIEKILKF